MGWITIIGFLVVLAIPSNRSSCPVHELEMKLKGLQQPEKWQADSGHSTRPRRILVVGLVSSLQDLFQPTVVRGAYQGNNVVDSVARLCSSAGNNAPASIEVNILYQKDHQLDIDENSPHFFRTELQKVWKEAGCMVTLLSERDASLQLYNSTSLPGFASLNRFQRLAKLRSLQRSMILTQYKLQQRECDVVINIDFDVITLPKSSIVEGAVDFVSAAAAAGIVTNAASQSSPRKDERERHGSIVCANGFEIWKVPLLSKFRLQQPHLYYDTFASIDDRGNWLYLLYSCNLLRIISLAQRTLFQQILFFPFCSDTTNIRKQMGSLKFSVTASPTKLWPMRSCFGGTAFYDWNTWSFPHCDYDASQITLLLNKESENNNNIINSRMTDKVWRLPLEYRLKGSEDGDACEHVVFQQCLRAASQSTVGSRLEIGIMPDFVVEREANLLSTREAKLTLAVVVMGLLGASLGLCLFCTSSRRRRRSMIEE